MDRSCFKNTSKKNPASANPMRDKAYYVVELFYSLEADLLDHFTVVLHFHEDVCPEIT
jgi:hypothetical protein